MAAIVDLLWEDGFLLHFSTYPTARGGLCHTSWTGLDKRSREEKHTFLPKCLFF